MKSGFWGITSDVINGVWNAGEKVYKTVASEVSEAIIAEATKRTREHFKDEDIDNSDPRFMAQFLKEKEVVTKEFKSMAVKGGLIAAGIGLFV